MGDVDALACCPALVGICLAVLTTHRLVGPPAGGLALDLCGGRSDSIEATQQADMQA
jgi:hypothetical protein